MTLSAMDKLKSAQRRTGSLLSIGLEPAVEYLPAGFTHDMKGHRAFLETLLRATSGLACAYKLNLAFFEAHGIEGIRLLHEIREQIPADVLVIADAKRGDIGSTARHYAKAVFESLGADSVTLNPLMGFDSAEPFLVYTGRLSFFLVLTSNPGAADFLLPGGFYLAIARRVAEWNKAGNCGFVVGATRPEAFAELRDIAPAISFLVPGIGAQGGEAEAVLRSGAARTGDGSGLIFHVTRGILPAPGESGDVEETIRRRTTQWRERLTHVASSIIPTLLFLALSSFAPAQERHRDLQFTTQPSSEETLDEGKYLLDPTNVAASCANQEINPRIVHLFIPSYGINPSSAPVLSTLAARSIPLSTGVAVLVDGLAIDCKNEPGFSGKDSPESDWADRFNVVLVNVETRNLERFPHDYGKYKTIDVFRGLARVLEEYPRLETRRLYLIGGSGGGLVALQISQILPRYFAEIYAVKSITKLTLRSELDSGEPFDLDGPPWGEVNGWASANASLSPDVLNRIQAERDLRSPLISARHLALDELPFGTVGEVPFIGLIHGDADVFVSYEHSRAYMNELESKAGRASELIDETPYVNYRQLGNYTFCTVKGADHGINAADAVVNCFPQCLTSMRVHESESSFPRIIPSARGYAFRYTTDGGLDSVTVETIPFSLGAAMADWPCF